MRMKYKICLCLLLILAMALTGCQSKPVEKICALPDRETQLTEADYTEDAARTIWNVQEIQEIPLSGDAMYLSNYRACAYFFDGAVRVNQQDPGLTEDGLIQNQVMEVSSDGMNMLKSFELPEPDTLVISRDGRQALFTVISDTYIELYLMDIDTQDTTLIWDADTTGLSEFGYAVQLHCQWSPSGDSFLFMPMFMEAGPDSGVEIAETDNVEQFTDALKQTLVDISSSYMPLFNLYFYNLNDKALSSYFILPEAYPFYDFYSAASPYIVANSDGSRFFVYFYSPQNLAYAFYINTETNTCYGMYLTDFLPEFTFLGSAPIYYDGLWYLHVQNIGIMVLDLDNGQGLINTYYFNDPIQAYTIYQDTLIVAQPAEGSSGVDVTAYLLNENSSKSVLLYHNDIANPTVAHMEIAQHPGGLSLLIQLDTYDVEAPLKLVLLNF